MSALDLALTRLRTEEGFRARAYRDTNGLITIGYGFNVEAGITEYAASALLRAQVEEAHQHLEKYSWYAALNAVRQSVCLDIAINSGISGLLRFPRMIDALSRSDWPVAAQECRVSDDRLATRYTELAALLLNGDITPGRTI